MFSNYNDNHQGNQWELNSARRSVSFSSIVERAASARSAGTGSAGTTTRTGSAGSGSCVEVYLPPISNNNKTTSTNTMPVETLTNSKKDHHHGHHHHGKGGSHHHHHHQSSKPETGTTMDSQKTDTTMEPATMTNYANEELKALREELEIETKMK